MLSGMKLSHSGHWIILPLLSLVQSVRTNEPRVNVSLRIELLRIGRQDCDETVYKVRLCAGDFTNECKLFGPRSSYLQDTCVPQGRPEVISFNAQSVETPIELDVAVQKLGHVNHREFKRIELHLTDNNPVSKLSPDFELSIQIRASYACLTHYFGKLCDTHCRVDAVEHICDSNGQPICREDYLFDSRQRRCFKDRCTEQPVYCQNNGRCVPNQGNTKAHNPYCICSVEYYGPRCEFRHAETEQTTPKTTATMMVRIKNQTPPTYITRNSSIPGHQHPTVLNRPHAIRGATHQAKGEHSKPVEENGSDIQLEDIGRSVSIWQTTGNHDSQRRKIILWFLAMVMFAVLVISLTVLIWVFVQRNRRISAPRAPQSNSPDDIKLPHGPKRAATLEYSPTRLSQFDDVKLRTNSLILPATSSKTDLYSGLYHYENNLHSPSYGNGIMQHSLYPLNCITNADAVWFSDQPNPAYPTLSRSISTLQRRRTLNACNMSPFTVPPPISITNALPRTTSLIECEDPSSVAVQQQNQPPINLSHIFFYPSQANEYLCPMREDDGEILGSPAPFYDPQMSTINTMECDLDHHNSCAQPRHKLEQHITSALLPPPEPFSDSYMSSLC